MLPSGRKARHRRASPPGTREIVDAWLFQLGARKPSARTLAAYRADVEGVAGRIDIDGASVLHLEDLTKPALRAAFASWASDHAAASVLRAHSAWSSLFDFLVAEDLLEGNPMAAIAKPRLARSAPKAIRAEDAAARLLSAATTVDTAARAPWPERDLALVALFLVSGIRQGEAVTLGMASVTGPLAQLWGRDTRRCDKFSRPRGWCPRGSRTVTPGLSTSRRRARRTVGPLREQRSRSSAGSTRSRAGSAGPTTSPTTR